MKLIEKITLFLILAIIGVLSFLWFYKPELITIFLQSTEYSRDLYKQAKELQLNRDYRPAYYTYGRISPTYKAYDLVLFQQAKCAAGIEDEKTAIKKYEKILDSYSDSQIVPLVSYSLGQAFFRHKQPIEAEKQFLYTADNYPGTDYAIASFYYLAQLNKDKNKDLATKYWLKYLALAPGGDFALDSYEALRALNYRFNEKDKKHAGIALFMQQKYKEALLYFNQLPEKDIWYYKAFCHKFLGNRSQAIYLFKKAIQNYLDESITPSKIERAMEAYAELSYDSGYRSWSDILDWTDKAKDLALYRKAQLMSFKKAKKIYEDIFENHKDGNFASEALWNIFWIEYDSDNYDTAIELGQKHINTYENTIASPAIRFWLGKIYEQTNNNQAAEKYYKTVLKKFPDSYYAFRASGRLQALKGRQDFGWSTNPQNLLPIDKLQINMPSSYSEIKQKHGILAAEAVALGDYETATLFIKDDRFLESWIKFQNGLTTNSIVTARKAMADLTDRPDSNDPRWRLIYPIYYPGEINLNAGINKLDPFLVISLLKEESHFNPFAVSSSNARGLMQVLPGTARDIVRWKGLDRGCSRELFNPESNIKVGTAYLCHTCETLENNMLYAVAAYNCGPAAVKSWLKKTPHDDPDRFVENIPYTQTRDYVKKVFGSYWNYKRVYGAN